MATYIYEARPRGGGELRRGTIEAKTKEAALDLLKAQELVSIKLKKKPLQFKISLGIGISPKDLVVFSRQFVTMIDAGLPLVSCLELISSQCDNPRLRKVLEDVKQSVEGGSTFSNALKRHPKVFDELFINLVAAGEVGGILDTIMSRLATYLEKNMKLRRQIRGALVYPIGILIVAICVICVMLLKVIPTFQNMFKDFGAEGELPGPTQFVIALSEGFISNIHFVIAGLVVICIGFYMINRSSKGKEILHRLYLRIPLIGPVIRKIAVARFTRTLGTLLSSGVPILDAMDIVGKATGNRVVEKSIKFARNRISEGKTMAEPLQAAKVFPPMVTQMIAVGEQTGALDQMLTKIADFYEDEVDVSVSALTSLLEPVMMVVIGGIVGGILIAMYLPIFDIAGKVKAE
jgi:type IV pilus assembly protein PilC